MVALTFFSRIPTTSSVDFFLKSGSGRGAGAESRSASGRGCAAGLERTGAGSGCDWNHKNVRYEIELDAGRVGVNGPFSQVSLEDKLFANGAKAHWKSDPSVLLALQVVKR